MAEWEDEDFGGFESADFDPMPVAPSTPANDTKQSSQASSEAAGDKSGILSWILATSPTAVTTTGTSGATALTSTEKNLMQNTSENDNLVISAESSKLGSAADNEKNKSVETDALPFETEGWSVQTTTTRTEGPTGTTNATGQTHSTVTHVTNVQENLDDLFASFDVTRAPQQQTFHIHESGDGEGVPLKSAAPVDTTTHIPSEEFVDSQKAIKEMIPEEPKIESRDNAAMQELQAKLDAVLAVKEQTEKSLETLQEEMRVLTEQMKKDLEEKDHKHQEELDQIRSQHREEMKELEKTSEQTVKLISQQYSEVWKVFDKQRDLEMESNANSILEKCTEILKQQETTYCQKLEEVRVAHEKETKQTLEEERKKMELELSDKMSEEREKMEKEMSEHLKKELEKEVKRLEEIHVSSLKEAMSHQQSHYEDMMKSTLQTEREKFADKLKVSVEDARKRTEKALEDKRKMEETRTRNHTVALKMLLTSALEQVDRTLSLDPSSSQEKYEEARESSS